MSNTKKKPARKNNKRVKAVAVKEGVKKKRDLPAVIEKKEVTLSLANPGQIMEFGKVLNNYIMNNNLSVKIDGKKYPLCGAWKFAGMNFGLTAVPTELIPQHQPGQYITILYAKRKIEGKRKDGTKYEYEKEYPIFTGYTHHTDVIEMIRSRNKITREVTKPYYSYKCKVEVVRSSDEKVVMKGESVCSNLEAMKVGFEESAVMGMAQTRTIGRSLKNLLDFVLNAAGMEGTPGEEMTGVDLETGYYPDHEPMDEPVVKKQTVSDTAFDKLMTRAKGGEKVLEKALNSLILTDDQVEALKAVEEKL